jgi:hypothetical protein
VTPPAFLVTVDAEGDDMWRRRGATTENARFAPRFQALCERYGLRPTWLTDYEMCECPEFVAFGRDLLERGTGEIGMHLHAWNSPPFVDIDLRGQTYLTEYPEGVMRAKVAAMTRLIEQRFGRRPMSHRAGRWALDRRYAQVLVEQGYLVDCSVTPYVSWARVLGDPAGRGGTDYSSFPAHAYFVDLARIDRAGDSPLLEVPVSIRPEQTRPRRWLRRRPTAVIWLRPDGRNRESMLAIVERAIAEGWPCLEFMLHSSELMPGGSPTFASRADVEGLYEDLDALFARAAEVSRGATLVEFYEECRAARAA